MDLSHELEIELVHQLCRMQCRTLAFTAHLSARDDAQFLVDHAE